MATKTKPKKPAAAKKVKAPAAIAPIASTTITFKAQREKSGPKTTLLALVPRKGTITLKALTTKAEAEGLKPARVAKWVQLLAHYGYVELA